MPFAEDVVNISDNDEDCILESVVYVDKTSPCYDERDKAYDHVYLENPQLAEFIEKCYSLDGSKGMSRVINRVLLKYYEKANSDFKKSTCFQRALQKALMRLETDPRHKFSHVKCLCEFIRAGEFKKRAKLITLSSKVSEKRKRKSTKTEVNKVPKLDIIDLETDEEVPTVNLDADIDKFVILNDTPIQIDDEKENVSIDNEAPKTLEENRLLVPQKIINYDESRNDNTDKIKQIEDEIAECKRMIAKLDEEEVTNDSKNSPYIKSEKLKEKIVELYKVLCELTGTSAVKERKVCLRVLAGHPEGPIRRLENFLNKNIGSDGNPPFPDFRDVVKCVFLANKSDNLNWSHQQAMEEARALFTHCGRALQKRRQQREWQDLLSKVKVEETERDPADEDPELLARLEANKKVALRKENELFERYSMMQRFPTQKNAVSNSSQDMIHMEGSSEDECDNTLSTSQNINNTMESQERTSPISTPIISSANGFIEFDSSNNEINNTIKTEEISINNTNDHECDINIKSEVNIKEEPEEQLTQLLDDLGDNYTAKVVDIIDPFVTVEISDSSGEE